MPLMSVIQYAKLRGCTKDAVYKAAAKGLFALKKNGKVDSQEADAAWPVDQHRPVENHAATEATPAAAYIGARAEREHYAALRQKQGYLLETNQLIPIEVVVDSVGKLIVAAKTRVFAMGNKLAPTLAHESDPAIIQSEIEAEARRAFAELSQWQPPLNP
jgi:hypothetical protein